MHHLQVIFRKIADKSSELVGTPLAFLLSVLLVVVWGVSGPAFHYSDTWQLIINTTTTVITFWLVFLIQSSQNKDTKAIQMKLDRLMQDIEDVGDDLVEVEKDADKMEVNLKEANGK